MKRIFTIATAALIAAPAFAQEDAASDEQMTMLQERLETALAECDIELDEEEMMSLTMAQVSGIVLESGNSDGSNQCEQIEAVARGDG